MDKPPANEDVASRCPVCGAAVGPGAPAAPFCSSRCRLVDLGRWLREEHRLSRPLHEDDLSGRRVEDGGETSAR